MGKSIKLYLVPRVLFDVLYTGLLFTIILNSSLIFKFNLYGLIGSVGATAFCMFFYSLQIAFKEKINIVAVNSVFYSFLLVISNFLYTYNDISETIMFDFSLTMLGIGLAASSFLKRRWEGIINTKF